MLKKQTVWLLTMLSLVIVLSVYYVMTPDNKTREVATSLGEGTKEKQGSEKETSKKETGKKEGKVTSHSASDDSFTALRLKMEDQRSEVKEKLQDVMNSTNASAEERNKAKNEFDALTDLAAKETLLETLIKSEGGYKDTLVRKDGTDIKVTVKAAKLSAKEANKIIQLVKSETGLMADVRYEIAK
ncbi:SpoIIIAH-like family protein [Bacillus sp. WLY-B-L8]|uniref:SpoIIIAH-like family protein n=1 Tax=Bacillus multifaciens TaxID=3068506 RepID=UPI0027412743|nr:SpoIIIAH-like family protein [Bacillus sp. WLY-B-L8]MDP7977118.1 SpoIIIAH-like family protein [Bacillus sp. WLY-B-L8]HDX9587828.1 SpoIIIAH-like family protein [Bacillus pseudomycoides]